jgi:hypothetical protein
MRKSNSESDHRDAGSCYRLRHVSSEHEFSEPRLPPETEQCTESSWRMAQP